MSKGLLDIIIDSIFDEEWTGRRGEKLTERELKIVRLFGRKGKILKNVYIPKDNGETSEIDVMYITQKGIFVFESKNYSGWIFGSEKGQYWTVMLPNKQKNTFYNPIKQNRTHLKWLGRYVGSDIPLFSIIVFSERCELKKMEIESTDIRVIKRDRVYATVRNIWDHSPDALSDKMIEDLYERLEELTNVDEAAKQAHIKSIKRKYKKDNNVKSKAAEVQYVKSETDDRICPQCGKDLVLRTARKGKNAGQQFYGCSGFPKCRYIRQL